ncbi:hypothetical protein HQ535_11015 [bacterium]|nr:hypothetical protein [bacterium]
MSDAAMDPRAFFEANQKTITSTRAAGGVDAVMGWLDGLTLPEQAAILEWVGSVTVDGTIEGLDDTIAVAERGAARLLATDVSDPDMRPLHEAVNRMSFNLSADLADCWPGDDVARDRRHFEAGLASAERAVELRASLGVTSPRSLHLAHWARGYHRLALGDVAGSIDDFVIALEQAERDADEREQPADIGPDAPFMVNIAAGYLGLARQTGGDAVGAALFDQAIAAFTAALSGPEGDDARFGIDQLRVAAIRRGL